MYRSDDVSWEVPDGKRYEIDANGNKVERLDKMFRIHFETDKICRGSMINGEDDGRNIEGWDFKKFNYIKANEYKKLEKNSEGVWVETGDAISFNALDDLPQYPDDRWISDRDMTDPFIAEGFSLLGDMIVKAFGDPSFDGA